MVFFKGYQRFWQAGLPFSQNHHLSGFYQGSRLSTHFEAKLHTGFSGDDCGDGLGTNGQNDSGQQTIGFNFFDPP
jgi:hypothetical protein